MLSPKTPQSREELQDFFENLHLMRIADMPEIELYLDQVLSLIGAELAFMNPGEGPILTGSMINNYVKQQLMPAPIKKRYTKRHLGWLVFICCFKKVLSMGQLAAIRETLLKEEGLNIDKAYDYCLILLERSIQHKFDVEPTSELPSLEESTLSPVLGELLETAVSLVATKIYMDYLLLFEVSGD